MEIMENITGWFSGTSFYQRFCVNLPVPFNNAYFDVGVLLVLGVMAVWTAAGRIHSLRFQLRVRRKKESAMERQLEQEAKEQERNRRIEAINQNNLLYMQFLQTAMLSHMAVSESAFEAWKEKQGIVSAVQIKQEVEPDPETIDEDVEKGQVKASDIREIESQGIHEDEKARRVEIGGIQETESQFIHEDKKARRTKNNGIRKTGGRGIHENVGIRQPNISDIRESENKSVNAGLDAGQVKTVDRNADDNNQEMGAEAKQAETKEDWQKEDWAERDDEKRNRKQGIGDLVNECTDIEQDLDDIPDIELPVLLEDTHVQKADSAGEKFDGQLLNFDRLLLGDDEGRESNEDGRDGLETNAGIQERPSTFDLLMENMVRMESMKKKQSSMQEEAHKVISHNISVLDRQIQSALQTENVETSENIEKSEEARQREALEAERRRIEREGSRKRFWRKKDGD